MYKNPRKILAAAALALACGLSSLSLDAAPANALTSDPLPGEAVPPPANINILFYYNLFTNAGVLEPVRGDGYARDTHISLDLQGLRYIRTFNAGGMLGGVQAILPYIGAVGHQVLGVPHLPPTYGPGRINLSHSAGFIQPAFSAFIFPISRPASDTYLVTAFWVCPPIGSYDKNANISFTQNLWTGEIEVGAHQLLLGNKTGRNLAVEAWGEGLFYGSNGDSALVGAGAPIPARLSEQPSGQVRLYLPYQFFPASLATFSPGFYQSFGGKETYSLANGAKYDAGTRTEETQLRFILSTYLSPHWQIMLNGEYDLVTHGGPLNRNVELRVATIF
ncbi:transporter [Acidocella sp.]|uniref:transporter n=1 Tax=Acidocella sp. TaxID=50710 RepID=UPI002624277D|nr:transporter [Acidocella sp.]